MTDDEIIALKDYEKAAIIKRVLATRDGKKFRRILELHFKTHVPAAVAGGFEANRMFYHDGQRSIFCFMDQVQDGLWDQKGADTEDEEEDEP